MEGGLGGRREERSRWGGEEGEIKVGEEGKEGGVEGRKEGSKKGEENTTTISQ